MENTNQHIDDFLEYYCKLESPEYAVMLKGKWGSGKTFYINRFKDILSKNSTKYIYVSLYGVSSYDEIETKFLEVLHPKLYNKKTILAGKIAKGLLKATLKVDLDGDDKADGSVTGQVPSLDASDILNTQNHILIFDDLERCSIPINDILGYINYFVEHQSYKVILIANEDELKKAKSELNQQKQYKEIKEKLIGKVFEIVPNVDLAIESFIKEANDDNVEQVFMNNLDILKEVYFKSEYNNLRLLRQTILDFKRFYNVVLIDYDNPNFLKGIIKNYFLLSIENKYGNFDISKLDNYYVNNILKDEKSEPTEYDGLNIKYTTNLLYDGIFEANLWINIINKSIINKDEIEKAILSSSYYIDKNSPNWKRLWYFFHLKDDEFDEVFQNTKDDLTSKKCKNIFEIIHICTTFLYLKTIDLISMDKNEILELSKHNIDYLYENKLIDSSFFEMKSFVLTNNSYDGLGFMDREDKYFTYLKDYIETILDKGVADTTDYDANNIINLIEKNDNMVYKIFAHNSGQKKSYAEKPIFHSIKVDTFVNKFINANVNSIRGIGYILEDRYSHNFYAEKLTIEMSFLNELKDKLIIEQIKSNGKVSGHNLKNFIETPLQKEIDDLQKYGVKI
jgi:hypothetical protein